VVAMLAVDRQLHITIVENVPRSVLSWRPPRFARVTPYRATKLAARRRRLGRRPASPPIRVTVLPRCPQSGRDDQSQQHLPPVGRERRRQDQARMPLEGAQQGNREAIAGLSSNDQGEGPRCAPSDGADSARKCRCARRDAMSGWHRSSPGRPASRTPPGSAAAPGRHHPRTTWDRCRSRWGPRCNHPASTTGRSSRSSLRACVVRRLNQARL
jgi:hypothetical protein